ncbi:MAG TPA: VCBS repeat-containing protein, partial [Chryseosolibacter sp.]|nr:VCBS repeat-containing protein [Chryseosolibacter sp.]
IEAGIVYEGYGLGLAFGDVNKDGYPDIYVSNDYISNDLLYINQGNGTFKNASSEYLSYQSRFSMGNEVVDINNDGNLDIMSVDMMPEDYARKKQTINGNSYFVYVNNQKYAYEPQYVRNMLHVHNGFLDGKMLPYSEVGQMMGIFQTEWSWSPLFADYDNDGDRDLLLTNGFPKDLTDKDFTNYKAQVYGFVASDKHMLDRIPIVKVSNYAFENTGEYRFEDRTKAWGMQIPSFSNGAAFSDLDNDGDLDYVVNNINDPAFVYRNNTIGSLNEKKNWIKLRLSGIAPNSMAIGAKVELWSGGRYQYHEHFLVRGYISSVDPVIHFGVAEDVSIDSVRITWPLNKTVTLLRNISANQVIDVSEKDSKPKLPARPSDAGMLFSKRTDLIDFRHEEEDYIDFFQEQRIIQHKFSQIGPCLAKGDLNSDGTDDIIVGGSKKSPAAVFLFTDNKFQPANFEGLTGPRPFTESDMAVFDSDGDGDNDVVCAAGGYENEQAEYEHFVYVNKGRLFEKVKLPLPPFPASVVRPCDYDHDGDVDIFVGARVKRLMYPFAPPSYVIINDKGTFTKEPVPLNIGMVTDAAWSDYNKDGWEDLVVTREWNSIAIMVNNQGKSFQMLDHADLASQRGLWSAIAAADLDKDGDEDYVIGNLGENHRFLVSDEYPMRLYGIDIDNNSYIDPLATSYWKDRKGQLQEYPINYLDELAAQSPFFRKKFTSYTKFSHTPVDSIIDKSTLKPEQVFHVNTSASFIVWNEGGHFKWEKLPRVAQVAPLKKLLVEDFNFDGVPDILLAGNDFSYDVSTGYYEANKGIVLLGKPDRSFEVLPSSRSGLFLKGQVSSLLYYKGEPSLVVAGINRDTVVVHQVRPANTSALAKE